MEIDLDLAQPRTEPFQSQVCIIGAGIAGLTLAHQLAQQGIDVALLEAGGRTVDGRSQDFVKGAELRGEPHLGTHEGRFRALGGASLRWGGQLLAFPPTLSSRPERDSFTVSRSGETPVFSSAAERNVWPLSAADLEPYYKSAEEPLAVDDLPYEAAAFFTATHKGPPPAFEGLNARLSKWTPFSHRNMALTLGGNLASKPNVTLYLHAQATELLLAPARDRIEAVLVRTLAGATFRFAAKHFIVAAGAVETSRLLRASRSVAAQGVGNDHGQVGRNFHDHLTLPVATFTGAARERILDIARPWMHGQTQHSFKLEADAALREKLSLNPILAHITLEEPEDSGLAAVRELLTARQRGDFATTLRAHVVRLPAALMDALHLASEAKLLGRRYVSPRTTLTLRLNAAQDAPSRSRITLSDAPDALGMPQPIVDWRTSPNEVATLRAFAGHVRAALGAQNIDEGLAWRPALFQSNQPLEELEDARHAMGGACMGIDPRTSVVDEHLSVHGVANLSIAGPSVFPDGSPQLPTLTMMALTLRLSKRLLSLSV